MRPLLMSTLLLLSPWTCSVNGDSDTPQPAARDALHKNVPLSATASEESLSERNMHQVQDSFNKELRSKSQDWSSSNLLQDLKKKPQPDGNGKSAPDAPLTPQEATIEEDAKASLATDLRSNSTIPIAMICAGTIAGLIAVCALAHSRGKRSNGPIGTHRKFTV
jgi:hypothetical protein